MCMGGGRDPPPAATTPAIKLHTFDSTGVDARRPQTQPHRPQSHSRPPPSRKGERPPTSRRTERPVSSSHGSRKLSAGSSRPKTRPVTAGPSSRKDVSSSSSRPSTSSYRERTSLPKPDPLIRSEFGSIPEHRPVQYTEDQTIINRVAELQALIDQHAENFYSHADVSNGTSESELNNPKTRHAIIRRLIAKRIIEDIIMVRGDRYGIEIQMTFLAQPDRFLRDIDVQGTATQLSDSFKSYAISNGNGERKASLYGLCRLGADLRGFISSNPSTWEFGGWDEIRGPQSYGYIMVFPTLLQDDEQAAPRRIFRI